MKMLKKTVAILLAAVMMLSSLPVTGIFPHGLTG